LDDALLIARRFEAANATMQTLAMQGQGNNSMIGAVSSMRKVVTCFVCNGFGHVAKQCPTLRNSFKQDTQVSPKVCYLCQKPGHIARITVLFPNQDKVMCKTVKVSMSLIESL
jgi:hypothetical protein